MATQEKNSSKYWLDKANELYRLGVYEEAAEAYEKAIGLDPQNTDLWNSKGLALCCQGQLERAMECFE
jgi:Tfp pilus assembly protein PilF